MNTFSWLLILVLVSTTAQANRGVFYKIQKAAELGNGYSDVSKYDTELNKEEIVRQGLAEMKAQYRKGCGPHKVIKFRRPVMKEISEVENVNQEPSPIPGLLNKLYETDKMVAAIGVISNNEISCSYSWFNFYGTDGSVLKLRYELGD